MNVASGTMFRKCQVRSTLEQAVSSACGGRKPENSGPAQTTKKKCYFFSNGDLRKRKAWLQYWRKRVYSGSGTTNPQDVFNRSHG